MFRSFQETEGPHTGCFMQTGQPIDIAPHNHPEPNEAIVFEKSEDYRKRDVMRVGVLATIEVADSSLEQDREARQRIRVDSDIKEVCDFRISLIEWPRCTSVGRGQRDETGASVQILMRTQILSNPLS